MDKRMNPWKQVQVAKAQRELVERQLLAPEGVEPFAIFMETIRALNLTGAKTLLDVGCGAGHYGIVCARYFPKIKYKGVDFSPAMIAEAKELNPSGAYQVKRFDETNFENYDLVLISQVLEYQPSPFDAAGFVMSNRFGGYTIFHRLRVTKDGSHGIDSEPCYCGFSAPNYEWNLDEFGKLVLETGSRIVHRRLWGRNATIVVESVLN